MPASSATSASRRLLSLLSLLQVRRDWPGELLAQRLEVSTRTVRRDVERLRELGYAVRALKGPDGGYRLDAGAHLPPLLLDDEQALALAVALRAAALSGAGIEEAAARTLSTMRQLMPARLRASLEALESASVSPLRETASAADPAVLLAIAAAIRAREELRFDYRSDRFRPPVGSDARDQGDQGGRRDQGGPAAPRRVQPHHLLARAARWYLVAWEPAREDWRIYRADRISPRLPTGPRFFARQVPGGDVAAFVGARFKGSIGADAWPCSAELVLARSAADVIPFAHGGVVEALGPDRCRIRLGSWSWPALAARIAAFDAEVEVLRPPELREAFAELAGRAARAAGAGP